MVIRMRHTRAHTRNRRSHHALKATSLATCAHCGAATRQHHMCLACGYYKGRQVLDLTSLKVKRDARIKAKEDRIRLESGTTLAPAVAENEHAPAHDEKASSVATLEKKTRTRKVDQGASSQKAKGDIA